MPVLGTVRSSAAAAAMLLAALALLALAAPAPAKTKRINTGVAGDANAKLSVVLKTTKSGKPTKVKSLQATGYDLACQSVLDPNIKKGVEVDFSFPATDVQTKRKGKYRYTFKTKADEGDPFTDGYTKHSGTAEGYFTTSKSGKLKKLVGYTQMAAYAPSLPGIQFASCGDPIRKNPFEKLHGSFSTAVG